MNRKFVSNSNFVLRKILNLRENSDILKDLIESVLDIEIANIEINKFIGKNISEENFGIADVRVETSENEELNIGIQIVDGEYIQNKMFLYYARIHTNQILYGDNRNIARTITINILDFCFFSSQSYHKKISTKTNLINDNIIETMEMHVLELPKFKNNKAGHISRKESWIAYMQGESIELITQAKENNEKIRKLDKLLEKYWQNEKIK